MSLEQEIRDLKLKQANQLLEIEMLASVNDSVYTRFGKTSAEILLKEKQLLREINNDEIS